MNQLRERKGLFDGVPGKSMFYFLAFDIKEKNELPELFQKTKDLNDHRLLALVTALIIENRIDRILTILLPQYDALSDSSDFSFSMKINLLKAFAIIPNELLAAAHILKRVRNEFAHHLEFTTFDQLPPKIRSTLVGFRHEVYQNWETQEQRNAANTDIAKTFNDLSFYCIGGIDAFYPTVKRYVQLSRSNELVNHVYQTAKLDSDLIIAAISEMKLGEERIVAGVQINKIDNDQLTIKIIE